MGSGIILRPATRLLVTAIAALSTVQATADELPSSWLADAGIVLARGDCTTAVDLMERGAAAGEVAGLYPARSFYLFHECAEPDAAERIYRIGLKLADGDGMPQDDAAAVAWLEWAEHLGFAQAQHLLAFQGLNESAHNRLAQWRLEWAAIRGDPEAQRNLAIFRLNHEKRTTDALTWLLRARQNGGDVDEEIAAVGAEASEYMWQDAREAAAKPPPGRDDLWWEPHFWVALDKGDCPTSKHYLDAAVAAGSDEAIGMMPNFYESPRSSDCFSVNVEKHREILEFVVNRLPDEPRPKQKLAAFYLDGPYRGTHAAEAEQLMRLAVLDIGPLSAEHYQPMLEAYMPRSETGAAAFKAAIAWFHGIEPDEEARAYRLHQMFRAGDGFRKDDQRARDWLHHAAGKKFPEAYFELAMLTLDGTWTFDTTEEAVGYLESGASYEHGPAQAELGRRLAKGDGVERDDQIAYLWLVRAGMNGEPVDALKTDVGERLSFFDRAWLWTWAFAQPVINWVFEAVVTVLNWVARLLS